MRSRSALLALCVAATPAWARDTPPSAAVIAKLQDCRKVTADAERLACFDRAADALDKAVAERSVVVLDREEVKRTRRSLFGFSLPKLPFFGNDRGGDADADEITRLDTTVSSAAQSGYNTVTVVLAEGGTWRFIESDRAFSPRAGDKITIKRGPFGNYLASLNGRRALRIVRVG